MLHQLIIHSRKEKEYLNLYSPKSQNSIKTNCDISVKGKTVTVLDENMGDHLQDFEIVWFFLNKTCKNSCKLKNKVRLITSVCQVTKLIEKKRRIFTRHLPYRKSCLGYVKNTYKPTKTENLVGKWAEHLSNSHKYRRRYSSLSLINKMQIKTTVFYVYYLAGIAKMKWHTDNIWRWWGSVTTLSFVHCQHEI